MPGRLLDTHREVLSLFLGRVAEQKELYKLVQNINGVTFDIVQMDECGARRDAASGRGKR